VVAFAKMERGLLVKQCWIYLGWCAVVVGALVSGVVVLVSGGNVAVIVAVIGCVCFVCVAVVKGSVVILAFVRDIIVGD